MSGTGDPSVTQGACPVASLISGASPGCFAKFPEENPHPVFRFRPDGTLLYANPASRPFLELHGLVVGTSSAFGADIIADALLHGQRRETEVPLGDKIYLLSAVPVLQAGYVNVYGMDVTVLKASEKAAQDSDHRLRTALDNLPEIFVVYDRERRIEFLNEAGTRTSGRPAGDFLGRKDEEIWPEEVTRHYLPRLLDAYRHGSCQSFEMALALHGGSPRAFSVKFIPQLDEEGRVARCLGFFHDITGHRRVMDELIRSRMDLDRAQSVAALGSWRLDVRRNILTWSDETYRLFGIPKGTPLTYELFLANVHPDDRAFVDEKWTAALAGAPYDIEHRILDSGRIRWVRERAELDFDAEGRLLGGFGTVQDITGRKASEETLREATAEAERASQAKGMFLANMSHELRTPLNGLLGMIQLAAREDVTPVCRQYLDIAARSGQTLLDIVNDILDMSKIEAGKTELASEPFSLRDFIDSVAASFEATVRAKGLALRTLVSPLAPDGLLGDEVRLRQIMNNIVGNAVKFSPRGEIVIRVEPAEGPDTDDTVLLLFTVRDQGIGIPPDKLDAVFESFVQAPASSRLHYGGSGLGLAISKSLVRLMNGRIWVHSAVGEGSTFSFTAGFRPGQPSCSLRDTPGGRTARPVRSLKVLLTEDNEVNRLFMREVLRRGGHDVETARDGEEALRKLVERSFDLVLMDVLMPVMDGLEAVRRIRGGEAGDPGVPVVALTAHALHGDRERFLEAGMDDYLSKPVDIAEFEAMLTRVLGRS